MKRFIDTNIFADEWFSELTKDGKLFFIYFITNCDHAGVLRLNKKLCEFQTGIKSCPTVIKELGNSLISVIKELGNSSENGNTFFMPKFIAFQYPGFPKSKVLQQSSALKILNSYGIDEEKLKSYLTVSQQLPNTTDNDNDNDSSINNKEVEIQDSNNLKGNNRDSSNIHPLQKFISDLQNVSKMKKQ